VTDSDDLWIEMAQFDTGLADGLWEGLPPPDDAPEWYGKVSGLIHAASAPAGPSDLAGEASIVARMQAAIVAAAADPPREIDLRHAVVRRRAVDSPRHLAARPRAAQHEQGHRARLVGRIVAVKAVALTTAVVLGVTAAAATTGIVATVVVPALQDRDQPTEVPPVGVDQGGGSSSGPESSGGSSGSWRPDCVLRLETCGRDGAGEGPNPGATGDDPADAATASGAAVSDATGEAVGDARTATTVPPPDPAPAETTTTTTQSPSTTTTSQPPPTTTTTQSPAPATGTSTGAKAKTARAAIAG
jgi:hypothetical protein